MSEFDANIDYIDAYFKNELSAPEKGEFEDRCLQDSAFAIRVANFIASEEGIRQSLLKNKKDVWTVGSHGTGAGIVSLKQTAAKKWLPYMAAACLLFAVVLYFTNYPDTAHKLADNYVAEHYTLLSQKMSASADSIEPGIAAYNNKDYAEALQIFKKFSQAHPENPRAKKLLGLVYLISKDYDKAIQQFDELAGMQEVYGNDGLLLKAITLLQKNTREDNAEAKILLQKIVNAKAEGSIEAEEWLRKW